MTAVPQLRSIPVVVYGHSLSVSPAPWHSTGAHWSDRLAAYSGPSSVTRRGVGGSHLEQTCNLLGGAGGSRWNPGSVKTLAIIQGVVNSAGTKWGTDQQSQDSIRLAAYHLAACVVSDAYDFTAWSFSLGWTAQGFAEGRPSTTYPGGAVKYTGTNGGWATFTVPAGISNRYLWVEHLAFAGTLNANFRVLKNGVEVYQSFDTEAAVDLAPGTWTRRAFPVGAVSSGDVVQVEKLGDASTGHLWLLGALVENGRNHTLLVGDPDAHDSLGVTPEIVARFQAHNAAVGQAAVDITALVPHAASFLDLGPSLDHTPSMLWTDGAHPNDEGQAWFFAQYDQGLRELPWTNRLHTL